MVFLKGDNLLLPFLMKYQIENSKLMRIYLI